MTNQDLAQALVPAGSSRLLSRDREGAVAHCNRKPGGIGLKSFAKRAFQLILGLLRELSDESAYQRHLTAHGRLHSGDEWRTFHEHRLRAKYLRAKCC